MARCWSCGTDIPGGLRHIITCPTCSMVEKQKKIRERLESSGTQSFYEVVEIFGSGLGEIAGILETGFGELSEQLENIASILEWGFEEIEWKLEQMTGVLKSIGKTLKTPSRTQANEWRQIAEELRRRGVLDESKKFFLKSGETNPLDYRTYIGLGKTYLQMGELDKARSWWEKSLPHAPKGVIDYKSYTYRLIGRLDFCEEKLSQAVSDLQTALQLSPNYYLGHYDYAQYCALIGDKGNCFSSLRVAVVQEPILLDFMQKERNFEPLREEFIVSIKGLIREEMEFRRVWRELGINHRCVDAIVDKCREFDRYLEREEGLGYLEKEESLGYLDEEERFQLMRELFVTWELYNILNTIGGIKFEVLSLRNQKIEERLHDVMYWLWP